MVGYAIHNELNTLIKLTRLTVRIWTVVDRTLMAFGRVILLSG
jgi:hypothetical protein